MYFYNKTKPDVDDIVACKINRITDSGIYVELLEYDNIQGYIPLKEISTHRYRSLSGIINENDIEFIQVTVVDDNYIDLTRKYINEDKKVKILKKYSLLKKMYNIINYSKLDKEIIKEYISICKSY
jgi:translation initiation factor 2 subunit 1